MLVQYLFSTLEQATERNLLQSFFYVHSNIYYLDQQVKLPLSIYNKHFGDFQINFLNCQHLQIADRNHSTCYKCCPSMTRIQQTL